MANPQVVLTLTAEDNLTATLKVAQDELKRTADLNKQVSAELARYKAANDRVNTSVNQGTAGLRGYRSGMAQVGYQLQDIAVQVQGGQNLGIILGQQGSQIASVFGPGGVVAGAFISIGALIGSLLIPGLFEAKKSIDELEKETLQLVDAFGYATEAQKNFLVAQQTVEITKLEESLAKARKELEQLSFAQEQLQALELVAAAGNDVSEAYAYFARQAADAEQKQLELKASVDNYEQSLQKAKTTLQQYTQGIFDSGNAAADAAAKTAEANQKELEAGLAADKKAAQEKIETEIMLNKTFADIEKQRTADAAKAAEDRVKAEETIYNVFAGIREQERVDAAAQGEWMRQQLQKNLQADVEYYMKVKELSDATAGNLSAAAGALAANLKEGTRAQQAAMAVQKAMAVGQAIMNMHVAISEANKLPFPANISLIARAAATGLSAIAGVQAVSFEGGGYTGAGIRAGGLDGRGGMPAIVHPNETVIDHTKNQGLGGVNINFTIQANDTSGFDTLLQQRRGLIISMINQAVNNRGRASLA